MPTVRTILPQNILQAPVLRVAAYCRVSTDSTDQQHSFGVQTEYYERLIGENPLWTLADIYADEGITGTSMKRRTEFNRMIADCKRGKIDRILTKSVSRFARNTVDCLETVRMLSGLGISILFEKEQIDTAKMSSEVILGMMSTQAQDESSSISGNMRWSYEKRMKSGSFSGCRPPYGYTLTCGTLVIEESEALVVRTIFRMYLDGSSIRTIVTYLNGHDIPRNGREEKWSRTTIRYILSNERYVGDALLQKYYTTDTLPHRIVKNRGERTSYYVENNHPPIISKSDFEQVQKMLQRKPVSDVKPKAFFSGLLVCPDCGNSFCRIVTENNTYWKCGHRHRGDTACSCIHLNEANLQAACDRALVTLFRNQEEMLRSLIAGLERLHERANHTQTRIYEIDSTMQVLRRQIHTLSSLQAQGILDAADFADQTRILNQRVSALRAERQQILTYEESDDTLEELYTLYDSLQDADEQTCLENEAFRRELIKKIFVRSETDIDIVLLGGLILPERLPLLKKRCKRS